MKTILITGASSGLGLAHALYLTSLGYRVYGASRTAPKTPREKLKEIILRDHARYVFTDRERTAVKPVASLVPEHIMRDLDRLLERITFTAMDVTDDASVTEAVKEIAAGDRIDVLVNNSGRLLWGALEETPLSEAAGLFETNYFGPLRVIRALLPHFKAGGGGRIVNTSSMAALVGLPFMAHYAASKSALERLTEALRIELEPYGVFVSSLLPGDINTAVNSHLAEGQGRETGIESVEIKRLMEAVATPEKSPYLVRSRAMWDIFVRNHILAPPPFTVSRKLERIIRTKKPKTHYLVGNFKQTKVLKILHDHLPYEMFEGVLKKAFGL